MKRKKRVYKRTTPIPTDSLAVQPGKDDQITGMEMFRKLKRDITTPTTYDPDEHIPLTIACLAEGRSMKSLAVHLGVLPSRINNWRKNHEGFNEAVEIGLLLSQHWWEEQGRINLKCPLFNTNLYMIHMQNRFGWTKKIDANCVNEVINTERKEVDIKVDVKGLDVKELEQLNQLVSRCITKDSERDSERACLRIA